MSSAFLDYFRCPPELAQFGVAADLSPDEGYFLFRQAICYGRRRGGNHSRQIASPLPDRSHDVEVANGRVCLPFDLSQVVTNLREERYHQNSHNVLTSLASGGTSRGVYYFLRPFLPVGIRKHLQRISLSGWDQISFPRWPVDVSVDTLMGSAMQLALQSTGLGKIPFIWFWPDGMESAAIVTHDVEDRAGRDFCQQLADIDESFNVKSAFQLVPEDRGDISKGFRDDLRRRGFEVNVHDLNHDGLLFQDRQQFERRAVQINRYVREFGSRGFRAGSMYRQQGWLGALDISFDMSVPNVAHLEPQRGGCCTVMPYFVGSILEMPLTTIQDYSLFHILGDYSTALWKKQIDLILSSNGLISILTHPDYLIDERARDVYVELLEHVRRLRDEGRVWLAVPSDIDAWWRQRQEMTLVRHADRWRIEGPGSERARVALATVQHGRLVYTVEAATPLRSTG